MLLPFIPLLSLVYVISASPATSPPQVAAGVRNARCTQDILPTPKYGTKDASFTVCTEELVKAPMKVIYDALLNFRKYSLWNTFVIDTQLPPAVKGPNDVNVGLSMNFITQGLIPAVNTSSVEVITLLDPPRGKHNDFSIVSWESGVLVQGEHPTSLTAVEGGVRMVSWETYYHPTDVIVLPLKDNLQKAFVQQGKDLKAYAESLQIWSDW